MNRYEGRLVREPRFDGVAPPHILRDDFATLDAKAALRCSYDVSQLILMQSIEGHAHEGHGLFYGRKFPNTTIDDISRSLRLDPRAVKAERQELIDEVKQFADRVIAGEDLRFACNTQNEPLMRCGALRQFEIEGHGVLQGLYMGGLRDGAEIRTAAGKRFGAEIGYGKCYLVDQKVLKGLGMDGYDLARKPHEADIARFERAGLFAHNGEAHVAYMYVRYKVGPGASDDAAVVMAGKMRGLSAAVGCFLADAVDTLEKYVPEYSDQDSGISEYIESNYPKLGLCRDDAVTLAYLCSIPREMEEKLPDSSLRHMLQIDRKIDQSTIESHLAYVAGKPLSLMELDHGECTNVEFYKYIEQKLSQFKKSGR
ncbi:MAG: hypothetical protein NT018_10575 [Armatimonadetes bacterium]|nr:hypothetical protein [Armatimonadota bacterium]